MARGKTVTSEEVKKVLEKVDDPMLIIRVGRKLYSDLRKAKDQVFNAVPDENTSTNEDKTNV